MPHRIGSGPGPALSPGRQPRRYLPRILKYVPMFTTVDKDRFLGQVPLFASIEVAVRKDLAGHAQLVERKRRQTIIRQGAPADAIYVVVHGHVKISVQSRDGSAASLTVLGPKDMFGELGVLGAVTRSAELLALEDATLVRIPGAVFLKALSASAALGLALSKLLGQRLRFSGRARQPRHRAAGSGAVCPAAPMAARSIRKYPSRGRAAAPPLNQSDLAELTHLSRQRANLILRDLRERRIVDWDGRRLLVRECPRCARWRKVSWPRLHGVEPLVVGALQQRPAGASAWSAIIHSRLHRLGLGPRQQQYRVSRKRRDKGPRSARRDDHRAGADDHAGAGIEPLELVRTREHVQGE